MLNLILSFVLLVSLGSCRLGLDVSQLTSESSFRCLKSDGYSFAVIRCFQSVGHPDPNCHTSVRNAHRAGFEVFF